MLRWLNRLLSDAEWRLSLWNMLFGPGGLITGATIAALIATYFTEPFLQYAPLSFVLVGVVVLLASSLTFWFYAGARSWMQILKFRERAALRSAINPLDEIFRNERIRVTDLSPPVGPMISNKTFVNCDILGPANVMFVPDCSFAGNTGDVVDGIVIKDGLAARNGFVFGGCTFRNCRFYLLTFMVPERDFSRFQMFGWQGLNWISDTPDSSKQETLKLVEPDEEDNS